MLRRLMYLLKWFLNLVMRVKVDRQEGGERDTGLSMTVTVTVPWGEENIEAEGCKGKVLRLYLGVGQGEPK